MPESPGVLLPGDSAHACTINLDDLWLYTSHLRARVSYNKQQQPTTMTTTTTTTTTSPSPSRQLEGGFWKNSRFFYVIGWTRLLRSILVLLFSEVVAHFVDNGSGMYCIGFAGVYAPRTVFPTIARSSDGEVCTADASPAEQFFLGNLDNISLRHLVLGRSFQQYRRCASGFFWSPR